jgi:hypothetical protein
VTLAWAFMMSVTLGKGYIHIPEILLSSSIAATLPGIGFSLQIDEGEKTA